jgi:hypothetical protein
VEELLSDVLLPVASLEPLRKRMLDVRNVMPELIMAELKGMLYLYSGALAEGYVTDTLPHVGIIAPNAPHSGVRQLLQEDSTPTHSPLSTRKGVVLRTAAAHRRARSISGDEANSVTESHHHSRNNSNTNAANSTSASNTANANANVNLSTADRSDVPGYLQHCMAALGVLGQARSCVGELSVTSDAAHRRCLVNALQRPPTHALTSRALRHSSCASARAQGLGVVASRLSAGLSVAVERLAVVLYHHLHVALAAGEAAVGK